ncbi:MAG: hypothetical protein WDZ34_02990 [Candidatus Saccharimonadales bacterium]
MEFSPEEERRLKRVVLLGTALALGSVGLKYNKVIGEKIFHASFWEASQSTLVDLIYGAKEKATRVAATISRDASGEIVEVDLEESHSYSKTQIDELEEAVNITESEITSD